MKKMIYLSHEVEDMTVRIIKTSLGMETIEYLMYAYLGTEKQDEYINNFIELLKNKILLYNVTKVL